MPCSEPILKELLQLEFSRGFVHAAFEAMAS
jgi:hypothetical protein